MLAGSSVVSCFVLSNYSKLLNTSATHGGFYCKPDGGWLAGVKALYSSTEAHDVLLPEDYKFCQLLSTTLHSDTNATATSLHHFSEHQNFFQNSLLCCLLYSRYICWFETILFKRNSTQQFLTTLRCQTNDNCNILQKKTTTVQFSCLCRWQNNTRAPDTERFLLWARCVKSTRLIHYCLYDVTLMPFGQRTETNHSTLHSKEYKSTSTNSNVHKMV